MPRVYENFFPWGMKIKQNYLFSGTRCSLSFPARGITKEGKKKHLRWNSSDPFRQRNVKSGYFPLTNAPPLAPYS